MTCDILIYSIFMKNITLEYWHVENIVTCTLEHQNLFYLLYLSCTLEHNVVRDKFCRYLGNIITVVWMCIIRFLILISITFTVLFLHLSHIVWCPSPASFLHYPHILLPSWFFLLFLQFFYSFPSLAPSTEQLPLLSP